MRRATLLIAPVLALALSACGGSGPNPGIALKLGDLQVTTRHVDDLVGDYCAVVTKEQPDTTTTLQDARNNVVSALAARMVGERFAEVKGIQPDQSYDTAVTQLRSQLSGYDEDTQDALIEIAGAQSYVSAVIGNDQQAFTDWIAKQHVTINPVYGMTLTKDQFSLVDPSISHAVSSLAKASVKSAADPSASPAPGARTCG